ncbi:hypothetical protein [Hanstruepera ponticola]|uniref:hypothetical protein n=1 Tax=Hanstruepera ponticola TaxID=2042995 RepID=UPI0017831C7B|nr:hypothetical protein [Hanstruepera ponticola]
MKIFKRGIIFHTLVLCALFSVSAQDSQPTMFTVHTDNVKFDKMMQYEEAAKELKSNFEKHNIKNVSWTALSIEDGRYVYVTPIKNMSELDKNMMEDLYKKMGEDKADALFEKMNECYDSHHDNVVHYLPEMSYHPESEGSMEGKNHREYHFLYYAPKNGKAMKEGMKDIQAMFQKRGIKNGYSVYHSGFGSDESYYMVSISGKDGLEIAQNGKLNDETFTEEDQANFFKVIQSTTRYDKIEGRVRPDLSYQPKN